MSVFFYFSEKHHKGGLGRRESSPTMAPRGLTGNLELADIMTKRINVSDGSHLWVVSMGVGTYSDEKKKPYKMHPGIPGNSEKNQQLQWVP